MGNSYSALRIISCLLLASGISGIAGFWLCRESHDVSEGRSQVFNYQLFDWDQAATLTKTTTSLNILVRGRIISDGDVFVCENASSYPDVGFEISQWAAENPVLRVADTSFLADWLLKTANGGECEVACHITKPDPSLPWVAAVIDRIDAITLQKGVPTNFETIQRRAQQYHGIAIHIDGIIGPHPTLSGMYLYRDKESWAGRDHEKALLLEMEFAGGADKDFSALSIAGAMVAVDGLYQRPYRDDPSAPNGRLSVLHNIFLKSIR